MSLAPRQFGQHVASEVIGQARSFLDNVEKPHIWSSMHEPKRGRMKPGDVTSGRTLLAAAVASAALSAHHKGDSAEPTHVLDIAHHAGGQWLGDQVTHARGLLKQTGNTAAITALDAALTDSDSNVALATNIRAYIALAKTDDATGEAITASYGNAHSRDAILRDGEHLAAEVDAAIGTPGAAIGQRHAATVAKDAEVEALAKWLHRWSAVAHRVVGAAGLEMLGLAQNRHHPAHRPNHPVAAAAPSANPPTST